MNKDQAQKEENHVPAAPEINEKKEEATAEEENLVPVAEEDLEADEDDDEDGEDDSPTRGPSARG